MTAVTRGAAICKGRSLLGSATPEAHPLLLSDLESCRVDFLVELELPVCLHHAGALLAAHPELQTSPEGEAGLRVQPQDHLALGLGVEVEPKLDHPGLDLPHLLLRKHLEARRAGLLLAGLVAKAFRQ